MTLENVKNTIISMLSQRLSQSGIMFRIFGRAKSLRSLEHKMQIKGDKYRSGEKKIQDMIGVRIVLYFPEDVEAVEIFLSSNNLLDRTVDEHDISTFRPERLNLVKSIPDEIRADFRAALPEKYAQYLDDTYEIQIRTVFSEGWHEVEHDMRYKCMNDWEGCDGYSRQLNGIFATLETAQWSMGSLFHQMSQQNMLCGNYHAMLRNQLLLRLADDHFSPKVTAFLDSHEDIVQRLHQTDRLVFVLMLLNHKQAIPLTYDNVLFLINRFDIMSDDIYALESPDFQSAFEKWNKD